SFPVSLRNGREILSNGEKGNKEKDSNLKQAETEVSHIHKRGNRRSVAKMETKEVLEMAWGLCTSNQPFLWVIRPGSSLDQTG
ncbi:hypothetical protein HID58_032624, partial [Brassica napus]